MVFITQQVSHSNDSLGEAKATGWPALPEFRLSPFPCISQGFWRMRGNRQPWEWGGVEWGGVGTVSLSSKHFLSVGHFLCSIYRHSVHMRNYIPEDRLYGQNTLGLGPREASSAPWKQRNSAGIWVKDRTCRKWRANFTTKTNEFSCHPADNHLSHRVSLWLFFTFEFTCWLKIHLL